MQILIAGKTHITGSSIGELSKHIALNRYEPHHTYDLVCQCYNLFVNIRNAKLHQTEHMRKHTLNSFIQADFCRICRYITVDCCLIIGTYCRVC